MPPALIVPAIIATGIVTAGVTIGTSMHQASTEKKAQKKALSAQEAAVAAAEAKVAGAEALAATEAKDKLKKQRLAQTQTILTSPLGISDEANLGLKSLLGGD